MDREVDIGARWGKERPKIHTNNLQVVTFFQVIPHIKNPWWPTEVLPWWNQSEELLK